MAHTVRDLKAHCRKHKLKGYGKLKKRELEKLIHGAGLWDSFKGLFQPKKSVAIVEPETAPPPSPSLSPPPTLSVSESESAPSPPTPETTEQPSLSTLQKIAEASYKSDAPADIDGWSLVDSTPTLKLYRKGDHTVVGVRGTADKDDLVADTLIAVNKLQDSHRFRTDWDRIRAFKEQHPGGVWTGVGHSLGGAVIDELLKRGVISSAVSYNPAVEPKNFKADLPNKRIYSEGDPLFKLFGQHTNGYDLRKSKAGMFRKVLSKIPIGRAYHALKEHKLDNFVGGGVGRSKVAPAPTPKEAPKAKQNIVLGIHKLRRKVPEPLDTDYSTASTVEGFTVREDSARDYHVPQHIKRSKVYHISTVGIHRKRKGGSKKGENLTDI